MITVSVVEVIVQDKVYYFRITVIFIPRTSYFFVIWIDDFYWEQNKL